MTMTIFVAPRDYHSPMLIPSRVDIAEAGATAGVPGRPALRVLLPVGRGQGWDFRRRGAPLPLQQREGQRSRPRRGFRDALSARGGEGAPAEIWGR